MSDNNLQQTPHATPALSTWQARVKGAFEFWRANAQEPVTMRYTAIVAASGLLAAAIALGPFTYPLLATARGQADPVNAALVAQPRGGLRRALLRKRTDEVQAAGSYGTEAIGKIILYGKTMAEARNILASVGLTVPNDALLAAVSDALDAHITETRIRLILTNPSPDASVADLDSVTAAAWRSAPDTVSSAPQVTSPQPKPPAEAPNMPALSSPIPGLKSAPVTPSAIRQAPVTRQSTSHDSTSHPL